jgi:hypothetical protein
LVFTRSNGVWTQQGSELVGTGAVGQPRGYHVALSADGNTAVVGDDIDNSSAGAAWVFVQGPNLQVSPTTNMVAAGIRAAPSHPHHFNIN